MTFAVELNAPRFEKSSVRSWIAACPAGWVARFDWLRKVSMEVESPLFNTYVLSKSILSGRIFFSNSSFATFSHGSLSSLSMLEHIVANFDKSQLHAAKTASSSFLWLTLICYLPTFKLLRMSLITSMTSASGIMSLYWPAMSKSHC